MSCLTRIMHLDAVTARCQHVKIHFLDKVHPRSSQVLEGQPKIPAQYRSDAHQIRQVGQSWCGVAKLARAVPKSVIGAQNSQYLAWEGHIAPFR